MTEQVYSAARAIQLNNMNRKDVCCRIGNSYVVKDMRTGRYLCSPHQYTIAEKHRGYLIKVKGSKQRYA